MSKATATEAPLEEAAEVEPVAEAPAGIDVDVATLSTKKRKGEVPRPVLEGYWVRLGNHADVPAEFVGHIAAVTSSPFKPVPYGQDSEEVIHGYRFNKDELYVVQTRDTASAIFSLPFEAFSEVAETRANLLNHG